MAIFPNYSIHFVWDSLSQWYISSIFILHRSKVHLDIFTLKKLNKIYIYFFFTTELKCTELQVNSASPPPVLAKWSLYCPLMAQRRMCWTAAKKLFSSKIFLLSFQKTNTYRYGIIQYLLYVVWYDTCLIESCWVKSLGSYWRTFIGRYHYNYCISLHYIY